MESEKLPKHVDPRFIGVNIRGRSNEELKLLIKGKGTLKVVTEMFKEILKKEVEDIAKRQVNPSVLDISEKLALMRRNQLVRVKRTLADLYDVARAEVKRREEKKTKKS